MAEADEQLTRAATDLAATDHSVADSITRLAELRCRQGRSNDAVRLMDEVGHPLATRGALDRGDAERAADLAQRSLRKENRTGCRLARGARTRPRPDADRAFGRCTR
jgi:hypothetical protein